MITGEIKRYLRDDGILKVSRSLKETAAKAYRIREQQEKQTGREPTTQEIARELGISPEELMEAMDSYVQVESLQQTIYQGEGNTILLMDKLEEKENQYRIYKMREKLEKNLGREPTVTELAEELGMTPEEIAMASDAATEVESIYRPIHQGEGTELQLLDKLPEKENRQERILDKIFLEELLNILGTEERRLICMRYFCDMTQTEVAKRLGISQVQVSRMEKRILHRLKKEIQDKTEV